MSSVYTKEFFGANLFSVFDKGDKEWGAEKVACSRVDVTVCIVYVYKINICLFSCYVRDDNGPIYFRK